jgi:hypothetical protein
MREQASGKAIPLLDYQVPALWMAVAAAAMAALKEAWELAGCRGSQGGLVGLVCL